MLQNIRDNIQGTIAKIIIALIIVPFAFFGIDSLVGGSRQQNAAEVNGEEIGEAELQQAMNVQKRRLISMMGENMDVSRLDDSVLREPALQSLIDKKILLQTAENYGVAVPDSAVIEYIRQIGDFHENGKFSSDKYQSLLRSNGLDAATFKQGLAQDLVIQQLNQGVAASTFVTEQELAQVAAILTEKRSFRYLTVPLANEAEISASKLEIETYYNDHMSLFQQPEQVKLAYIDVQLRDFYKPVSESSIKAVYDSEIAGFNAQQERRASHILLETNDERSDKQAKVELEKLQQAVQQGEDFATLAKEHSEDLGSAEIGGDLGVTTGDTFPPQFETALANLEVGGTAIVETDAGWHLLQLTDSKATAPPTYAERKPVIKEQLQQRDAQAMFIAKIEELKDRVFNDDSLAAPAKALDLSVKQTDWLNRDSSEELFAYPAIAKAAFSVEVLKQKHNSEVIELEPNHFMVIRIEEYQATQPKALADVEESIREILVKEKAEETTLASAKQVAEMVKSGKSIESIASAKGYEWQIQQNVSRRSAAIDPALLQSAFTMPLPSGSNSGIDTVKLSTGDVVVIHMKEVKPGSLDGMSATERTAITAQLYRQDATRVMQDFAGKLREQSEVKIL